MLPVEKPPASTAISRGYSTHETPFQGLRAGLGRTRVCLPTQLPPVGHRGEARKQDLTSEWVGLWSDKTGRWGQECRDGEVSSDQAGGSRGEVPGAQTCIILLGPPKQTPIYGPTSWRREVRDRGVTGLAPPEVSLLGLQTAVCSRVLTWSSPRVCVLISSSKDTSPMG